MVMPVRPARRPLARGRPLRYLVALALLVALLVTGPLALRWWTNHRFGPLIYSVATAPRRRVAIVFGAGLWPDGSPSPILADRVSTAVALYERGAVDKLLMTGDNRHLNYNEPGAMRAYAGALGVPEDDIVLDYAGRRTYDSCYRARHIFGVTDAVLVTQAYHLDRALFTAHHLGIDVVGVAADQRDYAQIRYYWWRELAATTVAYWQVLVTRPEPVMGEPLPIFDEGVSEQGPQRRPAPS
jgi:SanA protein